MKLLVKMNCGHEQMMTIHGCAEHIEKKKIFQNADGMYLLLYAATT